jgi:ribulose-phosphate 3-epimerase
MNLKTQLSKVERAGVNLLHYDVVDGRFNNCFMLGLPTLTSLRSFTPIPITVHLAVYNPERYIQQFINAGADYIAVHYEAKKDKKEIMRLFRMITNLGAKPLLAFRAETEIEESDAYLLDHLDWVIKLMVNPGYSGQCIQKCAVHTLKKLKKIIAVRGTGTRIEADGNINPETIPEVVTAGADILTGGSSGIFTGSGSVSGNVKKMLNIARHYRDDTAS